MNSKNGNALVQYFQFCSYITTRVHRLVLNGTLWIYSIGIKEFYSNDYSLIAILCVLYFILEFIKSWMVLKSVHKYINKY